MFLGFLGIIMALLFFAFGIALYVLHSYSLMKMAQNRGIENPWLSFIPIANLYIIGLLIGKVSLGGYEIDKPELYLPLIILAGGLLSNLPLIGGLLSLLSFAATIMALYFLYKRYIPENAILYTLLSIIIFIAPFLLFSIKDKEPQAL